MPGSSAVSNCCGLRGVAVQGRGASGVLAAQELPRRRRNLEQRPDQAAVRAGPADLSTLKYTEKYLNVTDYLNSVAARRRCLALCFSVANIRSLDYVGPGAGKKHSEYISQYLQHAEIHWHCELDTPDR